VPEALLLVTDYNAEPTYRARLVDRVKKLGIGQSVLFIGRVDHADMPALYGLSDVVVSVPTSDGLPQTLFEAMACALPAVLGDLPAYAEAVTHDESALLVPLRPESIAAATASLLLDPERRGRIGRSARERVALIASLPSQLDRVEERYREAVARPRPRRREGLASLFDLASLALR
jgi:glycosyltransferase involved in cell wall biosynthesis